MTTPLIPVLLKIRKASPGWTLNCWRMTRPKPSTFSRNIAWRRPLGPTTPTWFEIASSAIGWNPGKLPIRGNISSVFIREWPEPKTWTRWSAAIDSAKIAAACWQASSCVVRIRSIVSAATASQRSRRSARRYSLQRQVAGPRGDVPGPRGRGGDSGGRGMESGDGRGGQGRRPRVHGVELVDAPLEEEAGPIAAEDGLGVLDVEPGRVRRDAPDHQGGRVARDAQQVRLARREDHRLEGLDGRLDSAIEVLVEDLVQRAGRQVAGLEAREAGRRQVRRLEDQRLRLDGPQALEVDDRVAGRIPSSAAIARPASAMLRARTLAPSVMPRARSASP